jgi:hypothetical protein
MASVQERIDYVKSCAEERSQLQFHCLNQIDLGSLKNKTLVAQARLNFEQCEKQNLQNYPCLVKREAIKNGF